MATDTATFGATGFAARRQEKGNFNITTTYELSSFTATSTATMAHIAPGVTIIDMKMVADDLGTGGTVSVGDVDSASYWFSAVNTDSAATSTYTSAFPKLYASGDDIYLTRNTATGSGTVTLIITCTAEECDLA